MRMQSLSNVVCGVALVLAAGLALGQRAEVEKVDDLEVAEAYGMALIAKGRDILEAVRVERQVRAAIAERGIEVSEEDVAKGVEKISEACAVECTMEGVREVLEKEAVDEVDSVDVVDAGAERAERER